MSRYRYANDLDLEPDDIDDDDEEFVLEHRVGLTASAATASGGTNSDVGRYQLTEEDEEQLLGSDAESCDGTAAPAATAQLIGSLNSVDNDNSNTNNNNSNQIECSDNNSNNNNDNNNADGVDLHDEDDPDAIVVGVDIDDEDVDDLLQLSAGEDDIDDEAPAAQPAAGRSPIAVKRKASSPMPPPTAPPQPAASVANDSIGSSSKASIMNSPELLTKNGIVTIKRPELPKPLAHSQQSSSSASAQLPVDDDYERRYEELKEKQARIRRMIQNKKEQNRLARVGAAAPKPQQPQAQPPQAPQQRQNQIRPSTGPAGPRAGIAARAPIAAVPTKPLMQQQQQRPVRPPFVPPQQQRPFVQRAAPAATSLLQQHRGQLPRQAPINSLFNNHQLRQPMPNQQQQLFMPAFSMSSITSSVVANVVASAVSAGVAHGRRSVRIANCPPGTGPNDLKVYTELVGPVQNCQVYPNNGQAYITFCYPEHAQEFLQRFNRAHLKGYQLQLTLC
ncbi:hypothetical protein BOX15_Mlig006594g3 [Macrostomum lignano]|uniref:RRM domain-containing protein n=1 Tax=Macrostomum lignano TaxID=282301 RepID=A0A267DDC4_9PLAT|nr:hypothetical protein BOX15_Mlig006594g3 [Macrostomum lignano]